LRAESERQPSLTLVVAAVVLLKPVMLVLLTLVMVEMVSLRQSQVLLSRAAVGAVLLAVQVNPQVQVVLAGAVTARQEMEPIGRQGPLTRVVGAVLLGQLALVLVAVLVLSWSNIL